MCSTTSESITPSKLPLGPEANHSAVVPWNTSVQVWRASSAARALGSMPTTTTRGQRSRKNRAFAPAPQPTSKMRGAALP